jgi:peroxiredoxin Q/BCP
LKSGYKIVGISKDSEKSHRSFIEKFSLPFPLIADTSTEIIQKYDSWGEKKFMGKQFMGILRKTFVIDENGIIVDIIEKVNTKEHSKQILG